MKKLLWVLLPTIIVCLFVCFIATINVHTGSSSTYFYSAFEQPQGAWECKQFNLKATVLDYEQCSLMRIDDCTSGEAYLLMALDDFWVELHPFPKDGNLPPQVFDLYDVLEEPLYRTSIKHKRWFKTVYAFEIYGVDQACWYKPGNSKIRFQ